MNLCSSKEQCTMQGLLIIPVDHSNSVHKNINRITEPQKKKLLHVRRVYKQTEQIR